ncbi:hypothetical protein AOC36_04540 [Erysipelothrix larvae]|uniref:GTPase HflX n=1 Tax=Erysipelothrix larvae TaxID=1514105 RepID=A0A0X8GZF2_9FIRM|nr:GTPase HflX [Erysipelothrix larvae]AMC93264.1 hypothetical protein AOC36_04540 [Erysipelothrix larvae]
MTQKDKVLAVIIAQGNNAFEIEEDRQEFLGLAKACEMEVEAEASFKLKSPNAVTYFGDGNVQMVANVVQDSDYDAVIINVGLTGNQIKNLQERFKCTVLDKNMVLLQIFSKRAQSAESKARVEIANLNYMMSRMVGSYDDLGRQSGRGSGKNRGLGETKLELDRRHVRKRINLLKKKIEQFEKQRETQRSRRVNNTDLKVALVGYTNVGKSSLMNVLLSNDTKNVLEQDMVFASLDTTSRQIYNGDSSFILHDTVGYIENLPKALYPAFQSTRDEIMDADLILHVIDRSHPFYERQEQVIEDYLKSMQVEDVPVWKVYNKIDRLDEIFMSTPTVHFISTKDHQGIESLKACIHEFSNRSFH